MLDGILVDCLVGGLSSIETSERRLPKPKNVAMPSPRPLIEETSLVDCGRERSKLNRPSEFAGRGVGPLLLPFIRGRASTIPVLACLCNMASCDKRWLSRFCAAFFNWCPRYSRNRSGIKSINATMGTTIAAIFPAETPVPGEGVTLGNVEPVEVGACMSGISDVGIDAVFVVKGTAAKIDDASEPVGTVTAKAPPDMSAFGVAGAGISGKGGFGAALVCCGRCRRAMVEVTGEPQVRKCSLVNCTPWKPDA